MTKTTATPAAPVEFEPEFIDALKHLFEEKIVFNQVLGLKIASITPDKVEQIFEPFYTGHPGGTGLGLYISRELAERNGATLRYQPRPGGGSLFRIVFADPQRWHVSEPLI